MPKTACLISAWYSGPLERSYWTHLTSFTFQPHSQLAFRSQLFSCACPVNSYISTFCFIMRLFLFPSLPLRTPSPVSTSHTYNALLIFLLSLSKPYSPFKVQQKPHPLPKHVSPGPPPPAALPLQIPQAWESCNKIWQFHYGLPPLVMLEDVRTAWLGHPSSYLIQFTCLLHTAPQTCFKNNLPQ